MNNKYPLELTEIELNRFNSLQESYKIFENTKLKMMSVYQYMIKHSADSENGLIKSFSALWNMYKRYHKQIKSKSSFIAIIYKLEEQGFIFIEKIGKVNIYHARKKFLNQELKENLKENLKHENDLESIEITSVECSDQDTQILNTKRDILDIDIYNHSDDVANDNKKSFKVSKVIEKCKSVIEARRVAKEMLEYRKVINQWIYNRVMVIISYKYKDVSISGLKGYITTLIDQAIYLSQQNYKINTYYNNKALNKTKSNINPSTFANFTQREYDYDKLEKQLLGWE